MGNLRGFRTFPPYGISMGKDRENKFTLHN